MPSFAIPLRNLLCALLTAQLLAACSGYGLWSSRPGRAELPPNRTDTSPKPVVKKPVQKKGGGYYQDDGPGDNPPDLASIPEPVPKFEPLRKAANKPYSVLGQDFVPMNDLAAYSAKGVGTWYGRKFHGQATATGERYDMFGMTAAHPTLPIPSYARVTNLESGKSVVVRVNDRGPFLGGRLIDLSYTAAWKLGYAERGSARLQVDLIVPGQNLPAVAVVSPVPDKSATVLAAADSDDPIAAFAREPAVPEVVAPPVPAPSVPAVAGKGGIFLQLASFSARANAESFRDHLQRELPWLTEPLKVVEGSGKFRLHLGPYGTAGEAGKMMERLMDQLKIKPLVVSRPG